MIRSRHIDDRTTRCRPGSWSAHWPVWLAGTLMVVALVWFVVPVSNFLTGEAYAEPGQQTRGSGQAGPFPGGEGRFGGEGSSSGQGPRGETGPGAGWRSRGDRWVPEPIGPVPGEDSGGTGVSDTANVGGGGAPVSVDRRPRGWCDGISLPMSSEARFDTRNVERLRAVQERLAPGTGAKASPMQLLTLAFYQQELQLDRPDVAFAAAHLGSAARVPVNERLIGLVNGDLCVDLADDAVAEVARLAEIQRKSIHNRK